MTMNSTIGDFKRLTFPQRVFRCLPDLHGRLLFHLIDDESRKHYFSLYSLLNNEFIFSGFEPPYTYKPGLEGIDADLIYFHDYTSDDMPTHSGIVAFSIQLNKVIWSVKDLVYQFHDQNGIYVAKELFESKQYFLLNKETGDIIEELGEEFTRVNQLRRSLQEEEEDGVFLYSQLISYVENNELLAKFLPALDPYPIAGEIEYLKTEQNEYVGFYTKESGGEYTHHLLVEQIIGNERVYKELEKGMKGMMWESFFFYRGTLILTTGKNEISLLTERLL